MYMEQQTFIALAEKESGSSAQNDQGRDEADTSFQFVSASRESRSFGEGDSNFLSDGDAPFFDYQSDTEVTTANFGDNEVNTIKFGPPGNVRDEPAGFLPDSEVSTMKFETGKNKNNNTSVSGSPVKHVTFRFGAESPVVRKEVAEIPNTKERLQVLESSNSVYQVSISPLPDIPKPIDDSTFSKVSKIMSKKIPFVPMVMATRPEAPVESLYTTAPMKSVAPRPAIRRRLPPLFDRDGVISFETALRDGRAPLICASVILLGSVAAAGKEGLFLILAASLLMHMVILFLEKRQPNSD
jgi:hypothetical protein